MYYCLRCANNVFTLTLPYFMGNILNFNLFQKRIYPYLRVNKFEVFCCFFYVDALSVFGNSDTDQYINLIN